MVSTKHKDLSLTAAKKLIWQTKGVWVPRRNTAQAPQLRLCGTQAEDPVKSRKLWDNMCMLWQATRFVVIVTLPWKTNIDIRVPSFLLIIMIENVCLEHHIEKDSKSAPKFNYKNGHNWLTMCAMDIDQLGLLWLQATGSITQVGLKRETELSDPAFIQEVLYWTFLGGEHCLSTEVDSEVKALCSQSSHSSELLKWKASHRADFRPGFRSSVYNLQVTGTLGFRLTFSLWHIKWEKIILHLITQADSPGFSL